MSFDQYADICSACALILPIEVLRYNIAYGDSSLPAFARGLFEDNVLMLILQWRSPNCSLCSQLIFLAMIIQAQPAWAVPQQTWSPNRPCRKLSLVLESVVVVTALTLSIVSHPYHLRTSLWTAGAAHGWNSDPHERVYFYANYETPPPVPFIWSEEYGWLCSAVLCLRHRSKS